MSVALQATMGSSAVPLRPSPEGSEVSSREPSGGPGHLDLTATFLDTMGRYVLTLAPRVKAELEQLRRLAERIPSPALRAHALRSLTKRGNVEGAALFAVLAPPALRAEAMRALVAFQSAYNYLDTLSELTSSNPIENGEQLHSALLAALRPGEPQPDYYAWSDDGHDGGYLEALVSSCRDALAGLPSFPVIAPTARRAATRIVKFQALNLSEAHGGHAALERWASDLAEPYGELRWWEAAAGAGSSLPVYALVAAAAGSNLSPDDAAEIDATYFPSVGALHSLLDSMADRAEDKAKGQRSLLDYYASPLEAAERLGHLAGSGRASLEDLDRSSAHQVILTAMCSYYLSMPQPCDAHHRAIGGTIKVSLGPTLRLARLAFRTKRFVHSLTDPTYE
jgi:tetraprenyl-beta-curcumene synthase